VFDCERVGLIGKDSSQFVDLSCPARRTYEIFAAYWPNQGDDYPIAKAFNKATKYVVTRSLDQLDWETSLRQIRSAGLRMFSRSCSARIVGKPSLTVWLEFAKRVRPSVRPQKLSRYWPR
jgi:hypothetical protein